MSLSRPYLIRSSSAPLQAVSTPCASVNVDFPPTYFQPCPCPCLAEFTAVNKLSDKQVELPGLHVDNPWWADDVGGEEEDHGCAVDGKLDLDTGQSWKVGNGLCLQPHFDSANT